MLRLDLLGLADANYLMHEVNYRGMMGSDYCCLLLGAALCESNQKAKILYRRSETSKDAKEHLSNAHWTEKQSTEWKGNNVAVNISFSGNRTHGDATKLGDFL